MSLPFNPQPGAGPSTPTPQQPPAKPAGKKLAMPHVKFSPALVSTLTALVGALVGSALGIALFSPQPPPPDEILVPDPQPATPELLVSDKAEILVEPPQYYADPDHDFLCVPLSVRASKEVKFKDGDLTMRSPDGTQLDIASSFQPDSTPAEATIPAGALMPLKVCFVAKPVTGGEFQVTYDGVSVDVPSPARN